MLAFPRKPWTYTADSVFNHTRQEYSCGSFSVYFLFAFTASFLSVTSCLHIYTNLTLDKLSTILLLRNVILCLLCTKCWRLLGTNVSLVYRVLCIYICFLVLNVAPTMKMNSPAGKIQVLLGKDKIFCSYSSWTSFIFGSSMGQWILRGIYSFHEHNRGVPAFIES